MSSRVDHTDVGAYALGVLEAGDRGAFEEHLSGCAPCGAELAELSEVATALRSLGPERAAAFAGESDDSRGHVIDFVRRKAAVERRRRYVTTVLSVAAAVVLVSGGIALNAVVIGGNGGRSPAQSLMAEGERLAAIDAASGVAGAVAVESVGWGTNVALELRNVKGPLECELVAVGRAGKSKVVAGWTVPAKGYGVPGAPRPLTMQGGTALARGEIDRFEVKTTEGRNLLTIPA